MGILYRRGSGDCDLELSSCPVEDGSANGDKIGEIGGAKGVVDKLSGDVSSL